MPSVPPRRRLEAEQSPLSKVPGELPALWLEAGIKASLEAEVASSESEPLMSGSLTEPGVEGTFEIAKILDEKPIWSDALKKPGLSAVAEMCVLCPGWALV